MRSPPALALAAAAILSCGGAPDRAPNDSADAGTTESVCATAQCLSHLEIVVRAEKEPLPDGRWEVIALAGDIAYSGTCEISNGRRHDCTRLSSVYAETPTELVLFMDILPPQVSVEVRHNGREKVSLPGSKPTYEVVYPNGPSCQPVCKEGSLRVTVP